MTLDNKKCVPCEGGLAPLSPEEIKQYLSKVKDWQLRQDNKEISRRFKFKNFVKAIEFVNRVGEVAESEGHHPDFEFGWGYCVVKLSTHSIGGLHENDFIVAAKIDAIYN